MSIASLGKVYLLQVRGRNLTNNDYIYKHKNNLHMKRLVFAITLIALLCSCNNGAQKKSSSDDNGKREYAIEKLKDSTINAVYWGLHMGDSKENVLAHMKELQLNNRIRKFQPCPIDDDIDYRCCDIHYSKDSYVFETDMSFQIDSLYQSIEVFCTLDFYKDSLYSIVINPRLAYSDTEEQKQWASLFNLYNKNYGIGYKEIKTPSQTYSKTIVAEWSSEIWEYSSFESHNFVWTAKNVEVTLANQHKYFKRYEYEEKSFKRAYNKYDYWYYFDRGRGEIYEWLQAQDISGEAYLLNTQNDKSEKKIISYRDARMHKAKLDELKRIADDENARKQARVREQQIADSIRNETNKRDFENQII